MWEPSPIYPDPSIEILDPRFLKYRLFNAAVERLATGLRWGEGPVWLGDQRCLLVSDIPNDRILQAMANALGDPADRASPIWRDSEKVLKDVVAEVRQHGLARAEGRPILSVNAFSGVALSHEGEAAIGITLLGHSDHFPTDWDSPLALRMQAVVAEISSRLGWQGNPRGV